MYVGDGDVKWGGLVLYVNFNFYVVWLDVGRYCIGMDGMF